MVMNVAQSNLVMIGLHTSTPKVFWNGVEVIGITHIMVNWENDKCRVKLKVNQENPDLAEMMLAGITVKVEV